jgi:hypothetical protein
MGGFGKFFVFVEYRGRPRESYYACDLRVITRPLSRNAGFSRVKCAVIACLKKGH